MCPENGILENALHLDKYGFLSHNFTVADKSSMKSSVELRVPFATKELSEYVGKELGTKNLIFLNKTKYVLRQILYKVLPKKLVDRRKRGFNPTLDERIKNLGQTKIKCILEDTKLKLFYLIFIDG